MKSLVCPKCYQTAKVRKGKTLEHKIRVTLSDGRVIKVKCPGTGKKAI